MNVGELGPVHPCCGAYPEHGYHCANRVWPLTATPETAPVLRHIDLPLAPGAKLTVWIPPGSDLLPPLPALGRGFTIDLNGDRWRATVETLSAKRKGHVVELVIEGRYEEG